jgi:hypothetical protein
MVFGPIQSLLVWIERIRKFLGAFCLRPIFNRGRAQFSSGSGSCPKTMPRKKLTYLAAARLEHCMYHVIEHYIVLAGHFFISNTQVVFIRMSCSGFDHPKSSGSGSFTLIFVPCFYSNFTCRIRQRWRGLRSTASSAWNSHQLNHSASSSCCSVNLPAVFRSRIRIHMFLGLPDPDPLVRGMNPDPGPSIIMQK